MPSTPTTSTSEFEFSESQNKLIGDLAMKMGLVGFVMIFFGLLQLINGVTTLIMSRSPDRVIAAAQKAGMPEGQLGVLKESLSGGFWSSPISVAALTFAIAGVLLFLVGLWTREAARGFGGIALTKGKDISQLMGALEALHRKYGMIYYILLVAAIASLLSLVVTLWQSWRGAT
jgi:hypothetical protein